MKIQTTETGWRYFCPACNACHDVPNEYTYSESEDGKPSLSPTVYEVKNGKLCHSFIKDGLITYCCDSDHEMVNMTVEMVELPS